MTEVSKDRPFFASIRERKRLTPADCEKNTQHLVLDIAGSGIRYAPGDCVAVLPPNPAEGVERLLEALGGDCEVESRAGEKSSLKRLLTHSNLTRVPPKLKKLTGVESDHLLDHITDPQSFAKTLPPQLPRYYSIASSQLAHADEVHLTVRHTPGGICTGFLCEEVPLGEPLVPIYHQSGAHFALPEDGEAPVIMIGPGTGVAPYRAFVQERHQLGHTGPNWLFFGEWTQAGHFFYGEEWSTWENLRVSTAFSRDGSDKLYVQHKILEAANELLDWIDRGAYIYLCGDASQMAPAVDAALEQIVGREKLKELRRTKRYRRDVY
jgi:sulfite reductase (NADPH) flavoprotein alpha-component